ncbi:hypothetical protein P154DRAFT_622565 [Amniculicola lignicola CBS 123094]|uniref:Uncharacterized protein n=1 Tax=Amniculicola lignicola CBS 123094 TaxID=1392246 RepID=A0A6A5W7G3_9PLEO|nr:hypothetical protein P154DRAFT_622565 [Amniculicola lignicola CBS 123094]
MASFKIRNVPSPDPLGAPPNSVCWQSAFWPLVACALTVMLQNTGRVLNEPYSYSFALRSSPFLSVVDAALMLIELVILQTRGFPFGEAARHVWYDRFQHEGVRSSKGVLLFGHREIIYPFDGSPCIRITPPDSSDIDGDDEQSMFSSALPMPSTDEEDYVGGTLLPPLTSLDSLRRTLIGPEIQAVPLSETQEDDIDSISDVGSVDLSLQVIDQDPLEAPLPDYDRVDSEIESEISETAALLYPAALRLAENAGLYPGSTIDRLWRWNVAGFIFGTLPQVIKVFGMRGIPLTQTLISFYMISFIIPEIFRAAAGPADATNLSTKPVFGEVNFAEANSFILMVTLLVAGIFSYSCVTIVVSARPDGENALWRDAAALLVLTAPITLLATFGCAFILLASSKLIDKLLVVELQHTLPCWVRAQRSAFGRKARHGLLTKRQSFKAGILDLFALPRSTPRIDTLLLMSFLPALLVSATFATWVNLDPSWELPWLRPFNEGPFFLLCLFCPPVFLVAAYFVFRLVFMGSLSKKPRKWFGMEGAMSEFVSGAFPMLNLCIALAGYAYCAPFYERTYKPRWAEWLG